MKNQVTVEKTDWAGHEMWIICRDGQQVVMKMYTSKETAEKDANQIFEEDGEAYDRFYPVGY